MYGPRASLFQFQTSFLPAADVRNQTMREWQWQGQVKSGIPQGFIQGFIQGFPRVSPGIPQGFIQGFPANVVVCVQIQSVTFTSQSRLQTTRDFVSSFSRSYDLIITFRRSHCSVIVEKQFSGDLPDEPFLRRYTAASAAPGTYRYVLQKNGVPKTFFYICKPKFVTCITCNVTCNYM